MTNNERWLRPNSRNTLGHLVDEEATGWWRNATGNGITFWCGRDSFDNKVKPERPGAGRCRQCIEDRDEEMRREQEADALYSRPSQDPVRHAG